MLASLAPIRKALVSGSATFIALLLAQAGLGDAPDPEAVESATQAVAMGVGEVLNAGLGAIVTAFLTWAIPNKPKE